jgi:hypothetical protein
MKGGADVDVCAVRSANVGEGGLDRVVRPQLRENVS